MPDGDDPPISYARHTVDHLGRTVEYYLSRADEDADRSRLPLVVYVQGAGCTSLFRRGTDGRIGGGPHDLLRERLAGAARVMAVEKPGVRFLDDPDDRRQLMNCTEEFRREHTLDRWGGAVSACIDDVSASPLADARDITVLGHSEGAVAAAWVAAENPLVTAVGLLSCPAAGRLADIVARAREDGLTEGDLDARLAAIMDTYRDIRADPESVSRFAWGHPFRRWPSFLAASVPDLLTRTSAPVFVAHGTEDRTVPVAAADYLLAELVRRGRPGVTAVYAAGEGHEPGSAILARFAGWWRAR